MTNSRAVEAVHILNFRDYGGYQARSGRVVTGRLFRSAELAAAAPEDWRSILQLGISAIVDLRGVSERERAPWRHSPGFPVAVICSPGETTRALHVSALESALDAGAARRNMIERYAETPFRPLLVQVYRGYFDLLLESEGGTLVHCSAGKDRTGILVALLQYALGVHHDDIVAEYLLTNAVNDIEERIAAWRRELEMRFGAGISEEAVRVVSCVAPEFLESSFCSIRDRFGTIDNYLEQVLGMDDQRRRLLEQRLLVKG